MGVTLNSLSGAVGGAQKCSEHKESQGSAVFSTVGGVKQPPSGAVGGATAWAVGGAHTPFSAEGGAQQPI